MKNKLSISLIVSHFLALRERRGLWGTWAGGPLASRRHRIFQVWVEASGKSGIPDFLSCKGWGGRGGILIRLLENPNKIRATGEC